MYSNILMPLKGPLKIRWAFYFFYLRKNCIFLYEVKDSYKLLKFMEVIIMTCAARMRRIRMMETMERLYQNDSERVTKADDGTMTYTDRNGKELVKASMKEI